MIGAGVVGLSTALALQRDGWDVVILDPEPPGEGGASFGNAGLIATHIVQPIAVASILPKLPRMLLDETAPLAIRWRHLPSVLPWLLRLLRATRPSEVERISAALAAELRHAQAAFGPLLEDPDTAGLFHREGLVVVYPDEASLAENEPVFRLQRRNGVAIDEIGHNALRDLLPDLAARYRFGIRYPEAGHIADPLAYVRALAGQFGRAGGAIKRVAATGFTTTRDRVSAVRTTEATEPADLAVVAAGIWSKPLAAALRLRVPLESERGYHVTLPEPGISVRAAMMVGDIRFAITPMRAGLRLAGTIEFAGLNAPANRKRHDALVANARRVFPDLNTGKQERWMGHRPSLPDSLPVVGRSPHHPNVFLNFGHGHLGLTSSAITGRTVADLAAGRPPLFDVAPFAADRFHAGFLG